jgi:hypothetical protein
VKITGPISLPEVARPTSGAAPRGHLRADAVRDIVSTSIPPAAADSIQRLLQSVEERLFPGGAHRGASMHGSALGSNLSAALVDARNAAEKSVAKAAQFVDSEPVRVTRLHGHADPRIVLMVVLWPSVRLKKLPKRSGCPDMRR